MFKGSSLIQGMLISSAMLLGGWSAFSGGLPDMTVPNGCGMQIKPNCSSVEDLDDLKSLGFKFVRRGFLWNGIETQKGVYDFSAHDEIMKNLKERGIRVIGVLGLNSKIHGHPKDQPARGEYAKYAAALVERYKDHDVVWELWNEPNTMHFWGKHGGKGNTEEYAKEYVALVKEAVPAMRKADPNCFILAGSVSCLWEPSYNWTEFCFKQGILQTGINGWSVHPYGFKLPEDYTEAYAVVREIFTKNNVPKDFPMVNSERGFSLSGKNVETWAGGDEKMADQFQAWHFVRQYMIDMMNGVKVTIWYEWKDGQQECEFIKNGVKRPAYEAAKVMIGQLGGYRLVKRLPAESPQDYLLLFEKGAGEQKIVAWTSPPPKETPDKAKVHQVSVEVKAQGTVEIFDINGKKSSAEAKDGKISLTLGGSPQYVDLSGKK